MTQFNYKFSIHTCHLIARTGNKIGLKIKTTLKAKAKVKAKVIASMRTKTSYHIIAGKSITSSKFLQERMKEVIRFGIVLSISKISLIGLKTLDTIFPTPINTICGKGKAIKIQFKNIVQSEEK